jgi:hypothetical protein
VRLPAPERVLAPLPGTRGARDDRSPSIEGDPMSTDLTASRPLGTTRAPGTTRRGRLRAAARAALRSDTVPAQVLRFGLHFLEMAVVMMIGMMPLGLVLSALGQADLATRSPEAYATAMNLSMALPMAAWMLLRRHGARLTAEMTAAMIVPGGVVAVAGLAGLVPHSAAVSATGLLMWLGMLAAMGLRWNDYARHCHAG